MIQVENVLLSEDLFSEHFVCDLAACKGACCIEGDAGAPIVLEEIDKIEDNLEAILPFLTPEGKSSIKEMGVFTVDTDGDYVTTLNDGKECAFTTYDKSGTAKCGMEDAFRAGKTDFRKPSSCFLFPIRVTKLANHDALNYETIKICEPACVCGSKLEVKVYQFLKIPLIEKYGEEWYAQLVEVDKLLANSSI